MTSIAAYGQEKAILRDGVYEYIIVTTDTPLGDFVIRRQLIVGQLNAYYKISDYKGNSWAATGLRGEYQMKLKKTTEIKYKAKTGSIEMSITIIGKDSIEVEILSGMAERFYSGGQYIHNISPLLQEKQTLTFVRELTKEDEEKLK